MSTDLTKSGSGLTTLRSPQRNDGAEGLSLEGSMHRVRGYRMNDNKGKSEIRSWMDENVIVLGASKERAASLKEALAKKIEADEQREAMGEIVAEVEAKNARSTSEGVRLSDLYEPEQTQIFGAATCDRHGCAMCDVEGGR